MDMHSRIRSGGGVFLVYNRLGTSNKMELLFVIRLPKKAQDNE